MNSLSIKTGDEIKVTAGKFKGKTAKVVKTAPSKNLVYLENLGLIKRHVKPTQFNPTGGTKEIHQGLNASKVKLVKPSSAKSTTKKAQTKGGKR